MNLLRQAHEASRPTIGSIQRLFAGGELGGFWPEPKPSTVWQDTAGTTTGAVGSPVARRDDLSGLGYHAVQATTANCPILRVTPQTGKYWLDADATDSLIATFPEALGSTCTEATLDPELGVVWTGNKTVGTTYDVVTKCGYNGGRFLINRALTANEKAIVERVMLRAKPALGPELYQNPFFETDAVWTKEAGWSIDPVNGSAIRVAGTTAATLTQPISVVVGTTYFGTTMIDAVSADGIQPLFDGYGNIPTPVGSARVTSPGRSARAFAAKGSRANSQIGVYAVVGGSACTISNTSLKVIL